MIAAPASVEDGGVAAASSITEAADAAGSNRLLRSLPEAERRPLLARTDLVELGADEVLQQGESGGHAYFPIDCVLAVGLIEHRAGVDLIAAGNEGVVGMDGEAAGPERRWTVCRIGGRALRIEAATLALLVAEWPVLQLRVRRHADALTKVLLQRVLCARLHPRNPRCASWLLQTSDRVGRASFDLTHRVLAEMLGVRRATVTASAADLQRAGLIGYTRGRVRIVDRAGLEHVACPCYEAVGRMFDAVVA